MITKDQIKKKIDRLTESELALVDSYLSQIKAENQQPSKFRSFKLEGKLDDADLRCLANE